MKLLPTLVFFIFNSLNSYSQNLDKAMLKFAGYGGKLCVKKNEQLVIGTRVGEVAFADSLNGNWEMFSPIDKNKISPLSGNLIYNVNFFNNDTGFVSGFILGDNDKYNVIFHTENNGRTWKRLNFGQDGWVDDATNLDNGEAWMSVSGSGIVYTKDYGFTWKALKSAEKKQRFTTIFFNTTKEGIIGSLWNIIAVTKNNCETWTLLPTPLDQKKYAKTYRENRPAINAVASYKNYYLVSQDGLVFYTKKDSINWIWMPAYDNFYTDPENSALYFKKNKGGFEKVNEEIQPVYLFTIDINSSLAVCKNGSLFVKSENGILQFKTDYTVISNNIFTNQKTEIKPIIFGYSRNVTLGYIKNGIYSQKGYDGDWNFEFEMPFSIDSAFLCMLDSNTILSSFNNDSLFYYNLDTKRITRNTKKSILKAFCESSINQIVFENGSQGCFHHSVDKLVYKYEGGTFNLDPNLEGKSRKEQSSNIEEINKSLVDIFIKNIAVILQKKAGIEDLGFAESDYKKCKKDILKFKLFVEGKTKNNESTFDFDKNNIDFNRLISLVDSVKTIDNYLLNSYLSQLSDMWSTTTNWTAISFINGNGEVMRIQASYYESNAFYFPWQLSLKGINYTSNNIEINRFINTANPDFLENKNKMPVLYRIVKNLY